MEGEQDPREARITSGSPDVGFGGPLPFLPLAAAVLPVPPPPKLIKWEEGTPRMGVPDGPVTDLAVPRDPGQSKAG